MRRKGLAFVFAAALLVALAVPLFSGASSASADHDHNLITPGTTVVDIANGNTENCSGDPAYHKFHWNVHLGTPGGFGFDQPNNPVDVVKTENATC